MAESELMCHNQFLPSIAQPTVRVNRYETRLARLVPD